MRQRPLSLIVLAIVALGVLAALLYPVFVTADSGRRPQPTSKVKQLNSSLYIYTFDYDETFPPAQSQLTFRALVSLYHKNPDLFKNPHDQAIIDIRYNTRLSNVALSSISDQTEAVTLFTPVQKEENGPEVLWIASFADQSVRTFKPREWVQGIELLERLFPRQSNDFYPPDAEPLPQIPTPKTPIAP